MLTNIRFFLGFFVLIGTFIQCQSKDKSALDVSNSAKNVRYAKGFSIDRYDGFSILRVSNIFPNSKNNFTYILHKKNSSIPDSLKQYCSIEVPIKKIITTSTTHIPALESLNVAKSLIGFPTPNYISSVETRAWIDAGNVKDLGTNQGLNTEIILDLQPDVLVGYSVDGDLKVYQNLEKNGIKIVYNSDWTEQSPLGRAEWIKFFGALYDLDEKATLLFNEIEKEYTKTALLAKSASFRPSVFAGAMYKEQWFMPQGESWAAQFINDANANYLWSHTKGSGSLALSFEQVLDKAQTATFWIGPGQFTSYKEMEAANSNYLYFDAVTKKNTYSFSTKKGKTGGVLYYELAQNRPDLVLQDLVKILHPELLPNYQLHFFEKLK